MDKMFSTRIAESAAALVNSLARQLQSTKKQVVEQAIDFLRRMTNDPMQELWIGAIQRAEELFFMRPSEEEQTLFLLSPRGHGMGER